MLSESSYLTALYCYIGAALLIMLYLSWWLSRYFGPGFVALLVLLAGALLLTPAYPKDGVTTFAPALIVAAFQMMTEGVEGAQHALKPLAFMCAVAVVLALLLRLTLFRGGRKRKTAARAVATAASQAAPGANPPKTPGRSPKTAPGTAPKTAQRPRRKPLVQG